MKLSQPTLVVLDFTEGKARRYVPGMLGSFAISEAFIGGAEARAASWGDRSGLKLIEDFRLGHVEAQPRRKQA